MFKTSRKTAYRRRWRTALAVLSVVVILGVGYEVWQSGQFTGQAPWPATLFRGDEITMIELSQATTTMRLQLSGPGWVLPDSGGLPVASSVMDKFLGALQQARTQGARVWGQEKLTTAQLVPPTALRLRGLANDDRVLVDWLLGQTLPDGMVLAKPYGDVAVGYALNLSVPPLVVAAWVAPEWGDFTNDRLRHIIVHAADGVLVLRTVDAGAWRVMDLNPTEQVRADAPLPALPYFWQRAVIMGAQKLAAITPDQPQRRRLDFTTADGRGLTIIQAPMRDQWWSVLRLTDADGNALPLHTDGWALLLDDASNAALAITRAMVLMPRVAN